MINNQLTTRNNSMSALGDDYVPGTELLTVRDLAIPEVKLVQPQTDVPDGKKHLGEFYNTETGEFTPSVTAIIMGLGIGRSALPRKYQRDSKPLCYSSDSIMPAAHFVGTVVRDTELDITHTIGVPCQECPLSKFGQDGTKPLCALVYTYGMMDIETQSLFVIRFKRSGLKAVKSLNGVMAKSGKRKTVQISAREEKTGGGDFYVPVVTTYGDTPAEILMQANAITGSIGNFVSRVPVEPETKEINPIPDGVDMDEEELPM